MRLFIAGEEPPLYYPEPCHGSRREETPSGHYLWATSRISMRKYRLHILNPHRISFFSNQSLRGLRMRGTQSPCAIGNIKQSLTLCTD